MQKSSLKPVDISFLVLFLLCDCSPQWCEQDARCRRLQLNDLIISPIQHCTKVPLLLNNIRRYTYNPEEQNLLTEALAKLEHSLSMRASCLLWPFKSEMRPNSILVCPRLHCLNKRFLKGLKIVFTTAVIFQTFRGFWSKPFVRVLPKTIPKGFQTLLWRFCEKR